VFAGDLLFGGDMKPVCSVCFLVLLLVLTACGDTVAKQETSGQTMVHSPGDRHETIQNRSVKVAQQFVPGQVLVKFKKGTTPQVIDKIQQNQGLETVRIVSRPDLYLMRAKHKVSPEEIVKGLKKYEAVSYAEPNYTRTSQ
jgi:hypothetical protein